MKKYLLVAVPIFICINLIGQVNFINKTNEILYPSLGEYQNQDKIHTSLSVSIFDLNSDYYDDIVALDEGIYMNIFYNNGKLKNFKKDSIGKTFTKPAWTINTGDLDNDGISEIYTCGAQTYGNVYAFNVDGNYELTQELLGVSYAQNSNMVDINNDGFLDLFVCNENNYNAIYINDGFGKLIWKDYINFKVDSNYNNIGDYGSDFIDFDDDGDVDLFITKCWPAAEESNDPRRVNTLFVNDGNNNYFDRAKAFGLNSGAQSWTGMFGDMDNDGDLDCFVTNHDTMHYYYENIDNDTFIMKTNISFPAVFCNSIQASLRDFDNNGFLDILISGDKSYLIWNNGNNQYSIEEEPFKVGEVHSFGIGDFNNDGFIDIYASYGSGLNQISNYEDLIWINETNENHYLKLSLLGTESNIQGIGAKVKIFGDWGVQTRDARIGESYGITNSINLNFGLGQEQEIDSLIIRWPSGITDKYYTINSDSHYLLQEGIGMNMFFDLEVIGNLKFCTGDSVILKAPEGIDFSYLWSNGATTKEIIVKTTSSFNVTITNSIGEKQVSKLIGTELNPIESPTLYFTEGYIANCIGEEVKLNCRGDFMDFSWFRNDTLLNEANSNELTITKSGNYYTNTLGTCNDYNSDTIEISFIASKDPILEFTDTVREKESILIKGIGDSLLWYDTENSIEPIYTGFEFQTGIIEENISYWVENINAFQFEPKYTGLIDNKDHNIGAENTNGGLLFDCLRDVTLNSVKVYTEIEGIRRFQIKNSEDEILVFEDVFVPKGEHKVNLGFSLEKGKGYKLETDKDKNLNNLGYKSPMFYRDVSPYVQFPYSNQLISIKESYFGKNYYYYFYEWEVQESDKVCVSERIEVPIIFDPSNSIKKHNIESNYFYPNPASDYLHFNPITTNQYKKIEIYNKCGAIIKTINFKRNKNAIDVSDLKSGIYFIKISNIKKEEVIKIMIL